MPVQRTGVRISYGSRSGSVVTSSRGPGALPDDLSDLLDSFQHADGWPDLRYSALMVG